MSAEEFGRRLLAEIHDETLDQLLQSLRELLPPRRERLGVPAFDRILNASLDSLPKSTIPVITFTGAKPASGKTQLLYYLTALALLPTALNDCTVGGQNGTVVWIDLGNRFDVLRLDSVLRTFVRPFTGQVVSSRAIERIAPAPAPTRTRTEEVPRDQASAEVVSAVEHLHVFRPQSTSSFLATLASIPDYLLQTKRHRSAGRQLQLLVISDMSSFLWVDREQDSASKSEVSKNYQNIVSLLRDIGTSFGCTIVASDTALTAPAYSSAGISIRPHLPSAWNKFVLASFVVVRDMVSKFAPTLSVEEALHEAGARAEALEKSAVTVRLNQWNTALRPEAEQLALRSFAWEFRITDDGLQVLDSE